MQQEIRFATFNVCNLALPGVRFYPNLEPYTQAQYDAKVDWIAHQLDSLDADVIGFQEIFSQAALKDVLARTRNYQRAFHAGFDPDPLSERFTPSVALISRLPFAGDITAYTDLPRGLSATLPGIANAVTGFTRPPLHARILLSEKLIANVFVVHLKSKLPDAGIPADFADRSQFGIAVLRSLIRRGVEALGLRYLVADRMHDDRLPLVVMGDFNDSVASVTTQIVLGAPNSEENAFDDQLYDSYRLRSSRNRVDETGSDYTHMHEGNCETIDHILVSGAFNPESQGAIGEVTDVRYFNEHLVRQCPETSDHGIVLMRARLFDSAAEKAAFS